MRLLCDHIRPSGLAFWVLRCAALICSYEYLFVSSNLCVPLWLVPSDSFSSFSPPSFLLLLLMLLINYRTYSPSGPSLSL